MQTIVSDPGRFRFGDLQCSGATCVRRGIAAPCGGAGQACCPPTVRTLGIGPPGEIIPQGGRCNLANFACANNLCVACGGAGQPCCDLALSRVNTQLSLPNLQAQPPVCMERRQTVQLTTPRSCLAPSNPTNPQRCQNLAPGPNVQRIACSTGSSLLANGGACLPCGGVGQPCCEGETCDSRRLLCTGPPAAGGVCVACGEVGQPCCDCLLGCGSQLGRSCVEGEVTCGANSQCQRCGHLNEPCCDCNGGVSCLPRNGTCSAGRFCLDVG